MKPTQRAIRWRGWGFYKPCGVVSTRGITVFIPTLLRDPYIWKDFLSGEGPLCFPGAAGSTNPATPRSASGVGACSLCGAISTRATTYFVPVLWSCLCVEEFLGRGSISPPGAAELHEPHSISDLTGGVGVSTPCGVVSTRKLSFSFPAC